MSRESRMGKPDPRKPIHSQAGIGVLKNALGEEDQPDRNADKNRPFRRGYPGEKANVDSPVGTVLGRSMPATAEVFDQMFRGAKRECQNADGCCLIRAV